MASVELPQVQTLLASFTAVSQYLFIGRFRLLIVWTIQFQPDDALYLSCIGDSVPFASVWSTYCYVNRICFFDQCDAPEFASSRQQMVLAVQRAISAGIVVVSGELISLSPDLRSRFAALEKCGVSQFQAAEEVDSFLQSRAWDIVSDCTLPS